MGTSGRSEEVVAVSSLASYLFGRKAGHNSSVGNPGRPLLLRIPTRIDSHDFRVAGRDGHGALEVRCLGFLCGSGREQARFAVAEDADLVSRQPHVAGAPEDGLGIFVGHTARDPVDFDGIGGIGFCLLASSCGYRGQKHEGEESCSHRAKSLHNQSPRCHPERAGWCKNLLLC